MSKTEQRGAPTAAIVAIVGGALLAAGSFLPWAAVSGSGESVTAKGLDGSDGYITLAAGLVAVVTGIVMVRGTRRVVALVAVLAGLVGGGLALYDALTAKDSVLDAAAEQLAPAFGVSADQVRTLLDQAVDSGQLGVSISIGLYVAMAGGLVAIAGGVVGLRESAELDAATPAATAPSAPPPIAPDANNAPKSSAPPPDTNDAPTSSAPPPDANDAPAPPSPPDTGGS